MIASFSLLNATELAALQPELTVFLFPLGGLEQHGPHLPFGTKLLQAEALTQAVASALQQKMSSWNFVILPVLPLSIDTYTSKSALNVRAHVVRDAIVDQCRSLNRMGFSRFAAISSHLTPRQLSALEDAAKIVSKRRFGRDRMTLISVSSAKVRASEVWKSPMIAIPSEHGGAVDTATVLQLNPKLVGQGYESLSDQPTPVPSAGRFIEYFRHSVDGYWGSPKTASGVNAQALLREADELAIRMQPVLEGGQGKSFFRSGYRYFPLNGSFFVAYLLAAIFFIVMLFWVMWSARSFFDVP